MTFSNKDLTKALVRAIDNVDEATLRTILKSMCQESPECHKQASKRLLLLATRKRKAEDGSSTSKKSKTNEYEAAPRYEICKTCKKTFDVTTNNDVACRTHDNDLEIDPDYFVDDDEIESGGYIDVETDWRVEEYPDGFVWQCCDASANGVPCVIQRHIAAD